MQEERRVNPPKLDEELYKLDDIQSFIKNERRQDELARFQEVQEQKKIWKLTFFACLFVNLILLALGIWG